MTNISQQHFRHACETGDQEAQMFAFWTQSQRGLAAARQGDADTVHQCRSALQAIATLFAELPVAQKAAASIEQMDAVLIRRLYGSQNEQWADGAAG